MRHLLPNVVELSVFAAIAVVLAVVVALGGSQSADLHLAGLAVPLFIAGAVMGIRRNNELNRMTVEETVELGTASVDVD